MFLRLFWTFFKIGTFTLGGGYAMLPLIQREVVDNQHWIDEREFLNMVALAQAAPGIIAVNSAIFIGYKVDRWRGLLGAVLGAVLPSFCIILCIAIIFHNFRNQPSIEAIFKGIRPAVVALIAAPLYRMTHNALKGNNFYIALLVSLATALFIWLFGVSPVVIILAVILITLLITNCLQSKSNKNIQ